MWERKDEAQLAECKRRVDRLREMLERLDLVLEVEFSPDATAIPVIKDAKSICSVVGAV